MLEKYTEKDTALRERVIRHPLIPEALVMAEKKS
jgi:hypothetical protein